MADSTTRSHLHNRRDALGQGQISRGAASSSQEIVSDTISFDKLIIQGTGGSVDEGRGPGPYTMGRGWYVEWPMKFGLCCDKMT